ncbi:helix-turn-helix transcriptional regulator [Streptomyces sp. WAC01526]|uniref:helix-turn-helix domain-containing protein n=1 Tax=Streptomyces sp. WAC01526 TaxID=2588709 RepID=UPI0011DF7CBC
MQETERRAGQARLDKTQLAGRAGLGRTTVSAAFQTEGPVPSARTVGALARALQLPMDSLLELQLQAATKCGTTLPRAGSDSSAGPGKPVEEWEPHALEVHPAGPSTDSTQPAAPEQRPLPSYVHRPHDEVLAEAVEQAQAGHSRMVDRVGSSSTGKTRACWEAVQLFGRVPRGGW